MEMFVYLIDANILKYIKCRIIESECKTFDKCNNILIQNPLNDGMHGWILYHRRFIFQALRVIVFHDFSHRPNLRRTFVPARLSRKSLRFSTVYDIS